MSIDCSIEKITPYILPCCNGGFVDRENITTDPLKFIGHMITEFGFLFATFSWASSYDDKDFGWKQGVTVIASTAAIGAIFVTDLLYTKHALVELALDELENEETPRAHAMKPLFEDANFVKLFERPHVNLDLVLNKVTDVGCSLLCFATNPKHITNLIIAGANPYLTSTHSYSSPLCLAITACDKDRIKTYIKAAGLPNDDIQFQILRMIDNPEILDDLHSLGFNFNVKKDGKNVLETRLNSPNLSILRRFAYHGTDTTNAQRNLFEILREYVVDVPRDGASEEELDAFIKSQKKYHHYWKIYEAIAPHH